MSALSDSERRRYARQIVLSEWGEATQLKLKHARVLVVGAGGLGSAAISYLAAAGIGTIGIADHDRVELSNLQRQIIHETGDIGRAKTESARNRVEELNPHTQIETYARLDEKNIRHIIERYEIVLDGSDNFETRLIVADACRLHRIPLVTAAIRRFEGQLTTYTPYLGEPHPCYHCFVGSIVSFQQTCAETGILGSVAGIMGAWQALEACKIIGGIGAPLSGTLLRFDGLNGEVKRTKLLRDPACQACGPTSF